MLKGAVDTELHAFVRRLIRLRSAHPIFRRRRWFEGRAILGAERRDEAVDADGVQRIASEILSGELSMSVLGNLGKYRPKRALLRAIGHGVTPRPGV